MKSKSGRPSLFHKLRVDAHAAWLAARDPRCPWHARLVGLVVTAYALSPIDLIPDFIPILGLVDDAVLIPAGLWLFIRMLPPGLFEEHRKEAEAASKRPGSATGALMVIGVWLLAAMLIVRLWGFNYR
ncbi:YkvA family protein [Sphingosinicella rhizophila]|uniref:YkvA family protein n=1 Tax=Sphingosinicella rhizophila TaxID=3050082 RepID=A0ABU3Q3T5_9SPHN|nr:YkvA family protein [Sphingosinicella sp. GR2756]MDT9598088.1 YkvA family protein [Sphingosinicella sp. GR2756]